MPPPPADSIKSVLDKIEHLRTTPFSKEKILEYDKKEIFPEEDIRALFKPEIGLQRMFIPRAYGGLDGSTHDCCAICRAMAGICLGISTAFFSVLLGAEPLLAGGTETQKKKWLGAIAKGDTLVACAVTEAESGSNLVAIKTKAEPQFNPGGNVIGYKINGTKKFISTGGYADFITVLAKTPQGPSFFVVEKGIQGLAQGKGEEKHGIRASDTSSLVFNDLFVPHEHLLGDIPGQGLKQAAKVFGYTRLMVAAMALGAGEKALEIAQRYARKRMMFGSPLSAKQGFTHKLIIPNAVRLEAATAYIDETAARFDAGETDLGVEGSIAKLFVSEAADRAADDAMQALGGYGYLNAFEVEKIKRDVRITRIYEGTSEIQQSIISTLRWKKTHSTKGEFYHSLSREMQKIEAVMDDSGCRYYGLAAAALNAVIKLVNDNRLTRKQHIMFLLADMMTYVEVGCSLARKAYTLTQAGDGNAEIIRTVSRIFANKTALIVARNVQEIVRGSGVFDQATASAFFEAVALEYLYDSCENIIQSMDTVADTLFKDKNDILIAAGGL
ncbi:acyl-CoA dehydrogenase family protein [Desulfococcaceae bacterium HSG7]|nr:acyl-CoA dehydrogenase family protein [Desulfococcaceae bacterium HSG7]